MFSQISGIICSIFHIFIGVLLTLFFSFSITERAVEPLKVQLSEVDQAIKDQLDLIGAVKSNIIRNDQKIEKMLRTIAKS